MPGARRRFHISSKEVLISIPDARDAKRRMMRGAAKNKGKFGSGSADTLGPPENDVLAAASSLHCPVALALATLAGQMVYGNARAMRLFGSSSAAEFQARNLGDFCIDPEQMTEIEAVARDGRERQFRLTREIEGLGRHTFLCRVSRVAGRAGIPTWIAFAAQELEEATGGGGLTASSILDIYRTIPGSATWRMTLEHPPAEWRKNPVQCTRERFTLFGLRNAPSAPTAESFLDLVHVADRAVVYEAIETSLKGRTPFEVAYRLIPKLGRSRIILTRGMLIDDEPGAAQAPALCGVDIDLSAAVAEDRIPFDKSDILDSLAAHFDGLLYAVDPQFRYLYFNETFSRNMRELYGARTELHGKAFEPPSASARRRVVFANLRRAMTGVSVVEKVSVKLKHSGMTTYEITYAPMAVASQTRGVVVFGVRSA
jgi:PAS domain-containing protein